jgi:beta-aspartyl-peptidase (threonine type)
MDIPEWGAITMPARHRALADTDLRGLEFDMQTGYGEEFMRSVISKTISDFICMKGMNAAEATAAGIAYLRRRVKGRGGVIVIDRDGNCSAGFTTGKMLHGWIEHGADAIVRF